MSRSTLALAIAAAIVTQQAAAAGFLEDSSVRLDARNFYLKQDFDNNATDLEQWGQGFVLNARSGFTEGALGFGLDAQGLLGIKLHSDAPDNSSQLFPLDGDEPADQFSKLGLTAKARVGKTEARIGTLQPRLPVVISNDGRLLPQTFEGAQLTSKDLEGLTLTAGLLDKARGRASSDRTGLASKGGREESDFLFAGGDYAISKDLTAQYYYGGLDDYYQQHFVGLRHAVALGSGKLATDLRYFDTAAEGANQDRKAGYGAKIDNQLWSALFSYRLAGHTLTAGYQQSRGDTDFGQLNQSGLAGKGAGGASNYLITERFINNFGRAGEDTWLAQYGYDFGQLGLKGLSASVLYQKGEWDNAANVTQSEWERDIQVGYTVADGALKGLGVQWRNGVLRSDGSAAQDHNRLTISYSLVLL
jgi:hypothetical protein